MKATTQRQLSPNLPSLNCYGERYCDSWDQTSSHSALILGSETGQVVQIQRLQPSRWSDLFGRAARGCVVRIPHLQTSSGGWELADDLSEVLNEALNALRQLRILNLEASEIVENAKSILGLSVSDIASAVGVSRQSLYNWIDGKTPVSSLHSSKLDAINSASIRFKDEGVNQLPRSMRSYLLDCIQRDGIDIAGWELQVSRLIERLKVRNGKNNGVREIISSESELSISARRISDRT